MSSTLDSLLNLPGVTTEGSVQVEGYVCLQVKILAPGINCPHCQNPIQELHQSLTGRQYGLKSLFDKECSVLW